MPNEPFEVETAPDGDDPNVKPLERAPEDAAPKLSIHMTPEEFAPIQARALEEAKAEPREQYVAPPNPKRVGVYTPLTPGEMRRDAQRESAVLRARRSNMLRKLRKHYELYEMFSAEEAAEKLKMEPGEVDRYLVSETVLPGSLIGNDGGEKYFLVSAFG